MEEQIASLAGLVHHALSMGSDVPGIKNTIRSVTSAFYPTAVHTAYIPLTIDKFNQEIMMENMIVTLILTIKAYLGLLVMYLCTFSVRILDTNSSATELVRIFYTYYILWIDYALHMLRTLNCLSVTFRSVIWGFQPSRCNWQLQSRPSDSSGLSFCQQAAATTRVCKDKSVWSANATQPTQTFTGTDSQYSTFNGQYRTQNTAFNYHAMFVTLG